VGNSLQSYRMPLCRLRVPSSKRYPTRSATVIILRSSNWLSRAGMDGVAPRSLRLYRQFYLAYPELCRQRVAPTSSGVPSLPIWQTLSAKLQQLLPAENARYNPPSSVSAMDPELLVSRLSFSHFAELITIEDPHERAFYEIECIRGGWSVRELKRQIGAFYFERSMFSRDPDRLADLMQIGARGDIVPCEVSQLAQVVDDPCGRKVSCANIDN
jgi:hypothetical protein